MKKQKITNSELLTMIDEAESIIRIADIKVNSETIAASAISVANGNTQDKEILDSKIQDVENIIRGLKSGKHIDGQEIEEIQKQQIKKRKIPKKRKSEVKKRKEEKKMSECPAPIISELLSCSPPTFGDIYFFCEKN